MIGCTDMIRKSDRRHYCKYIMRILLQTPPSEWMTGEDICKRFDDLCARGLVLDTNGNVCKGFAYDYLFAEVIGYKKGLLVELECYPAVPRDRSLLFPAYKNMRFRIRPDCYKSVSDYYG